MEITETLSFVTIAIFVVTLTAAAIVASLFALAGRKTGAERDHNPAYDEGSL